ncbi:hypothetical protein HBI56_048810 [Parastagonospora nodorum]|uniref:Heterokaryon incompatibility domain-containing protein n=1 Tax=Phaeosphaeria nodorum (strain SN15 / ATCC MYA-4574 / FGSC 10173) TaxID=321614 RepID=A0A7U2EVV6_PHANO|nr:hypothetical protein HBH56_061730 [Parastagonospora nodorum]QRC91999.1 hypothetical protein JI435_021650 [Parastagonospora nodorum SN15]KAH3931129.1 hypothetical protein HBH54_105670 [Parastagonospora nodorum]KAH4027585.1 hypothetical protein HBI09_140620 [Parastagonospora nodorum]KAH4140534.1 hypothetical protein HBH45_076050 [Parastagonospora nodorum]
MTPQSIARRISRKLDFAIRGLSKTSVVYKSLNLANCEIRLLHIAPGLKHSTIEVSTSISVLPHPYIPSPYPRADDESELTNGICDPYEALSYEWGNPEAPRHTIFLDGQNFKVRDNLFQALVCFRDMGVTGALWIDAICINQADHRERGHQVQMMGLIYTHALRVRVWLGADFPEFSDSVQFVSRLVHLGELGPGARTVTKVTNREFNKDGKENSSCGERPLSNYADHRASIVAAEEGWRALIALLNHSYWHRIWIIQEYLLARELIIHCSRSSMRHQDLKTAIGVCFSSLCMSDANTEMPIMQSPGFKILDMCESHDPLSQRVFKLPIPTLSLLELLKMTEESACHDPHDRIYAIMGLAEDLQHAVVRIDYDAPLEAVKAGVISALKHTSVIQLYICLVCHLLDVILAEEIFGEDDPADVMFDHRGCECQRKQTETTNRSKEM